MHVYTNRNIQIPSNNVSSLCFLVFPTVVSVLSSKIQDCKTHNELCAYEFNGNNPKEEPENFQTAIKLQLRGKPLANNYFWQQYRNIKSPQFESHGI